MNTTLPPARRAKRCGGFSMVEVTLALGIAGFCLAALLGLIPLGSNQNAEASKATAATGLASAILADVRAADPAATKSSLYRLALPDTKTASVTLNVLYLTDAGEPLAAPTVTTPDGKTRTARYRATVNLVAPPPTDPAHPQATAVDLKIWEPVTLTAAPAAGAVEVATCVTR